MDIILKYFSDFSEEQLRQMQALKALYQEWNAKINVISRKDMDNFYEHHVLHSLAIAAAVEFQPGTQVIDIGCGGGFPSVPLAVYFPEAEFLAVDSINKKLTVLKEVAAAAGLKNITTQHTRAEEIKNRKFDFAVSRAVAPLKDLWRWSKLLLKKGMNGEVANGLLCLKGGDLAQEISESNVRPHVMNIHAIFPEDFFAEKYLLHVKA